MLSLGDRDVFLFDHCVIIRHILGDGNVQIN